MKVGKHTGDQELCIAKNFVYQSSCLKVYMVRLLLIAVRILRIMGAHYDQALENYYFSLLPAKGKSQNFIFNI